MHISADSQSISGAYCKASSPTIGQLRKDRKNHWRFLAVLGMSSWQDCLQSVKESELSEVRPASYLEI